MSTRKEEFMSSLNTVVFDMDGVLIDSEPYWRLAIRHVFSEVGLELSEEDCHATMGWRIDRVVRHWIAVHRLSPEETQPLLAAIIARVAELIETQGQPIAGVVDLIHSFHEHRWKVGLATSSPTLVMEAALRRLGLTNSFHTVQSAEHLSHGKPHPQVYLNALEALDSLPQHSVAIEDSVTGLIAAKAASMKCLVHPSLETAGDPRWCLADGVVRDFTTLSALTVLRLLAS